MNNSSQYPPEFAPGYLEERTWSHTVHNTAIAFITIETTAFALRLFSRRLQKNGMSWGDGFMLISWIFNLATCAAAIFTVSFSIESYNGFLRPWQVVPYNQFIDYVLPSLYLPAVTFPKLSVLDIYLKLFITKLPRLISWTTGFILVAGLVANSIVVVVQCQPVSQLWNPVPDGHCIDNQVFFTWAGLPNIITDFIMLVLPLPTIWSLQTTRGTKIGIFLTLLVGNLGLITSVFRFIAFDHITTNEVWLGSKAVAWTVIEPGVYHVCACLITYRPMLTWVATKSAVAPILQKHVLLKKGSGPRRSAMGEATRSFQRRWLAGRDRVRRNSDELVLTNVSRDHTLPPGQTSGDAISSVPDGAIPVQDGIETVERVPGQDMSQRPRTGQFA